MKITCVDIQNFRKLKSCRIELAPNETIFVGANNSDKTSAMDALILFLKKSKRKYISTTDFTLSNWLKINQIAENWISNTNPDTRDITNFVLQPFLPAIDIWLQVDDSDIHHVSHIIPTLNWESGLLGVRLIIEPENVENLYKEYKTAYNDAQVTASFVKKSSDKGKQTSLYLWPQSMREFLNKELHKHFVVRAYILDPEKYNGDPQCLLTESEPLEGDPFDGIFKIDIINAQRGFSDQNSEEGFSSADRRLSTQFRQYYDKHLDPTELPDPSDIGALEAIETARTAFDEKLKNSFSSAIREIEDLNYPGFSDPEITLSSKIEAQEGLKHDAAVQFKVNQVGQSEDIPLCLPEKYNGLGYQNLISIIFSLIRFRDEWMLFGKAEKRERQTDSFIEPLHLVLIEEPEAHLHAQVQQVFIKKAYHVLRNHPRLLREKTQLSTQMVISTHSSHIAHEIDFTCLRYFRRTSAVNTGDVPCAEVVNLTNTFGKDDDTSKFATRYLKTTHCDLFFADAAILVEGTAERMLIPHFICNNFQELNKSYLSILEIGGSHAHRLKPLIEILGLLTLLITDIDSIEETRPKKVIPKKNKRYRTSNNTLKDWVPEKTNLDDLLVNNVIKETSSGDVRAAYQNEISVKFKKGEEVEEEKAIPYTFEDALVLSNLEFFRSQKQASGLIKKMSDAANKASLNEAIEDMFEASEHGKKAEMALELFCLADPTLLTLPEYINEGLVWLQSKLKARCRDER